MNLRKELIWISIIAVFVLVLNWFWKTSDFIELSMKAFLLFFVIPALYLFLTKKNLKNFGINKLKLKQSISWIILLSAGALPFIYFFSNQADFQSYYPMWKSFGLTLPNFIKFELLLLINLFAVEFFFRGFLINTLRKYFARWAVLIQAVPYALIHIGKPAPELMLSLVAGLILGVIAYRTKSIIPALGTHFIWAVVFDMFILFG